MKKQRLTTPLWHTCRLAMSALLVGLLIGSVPLQAQRIECFAGANLHHLRLVKPYSTGSDVESKVGYTFGVGISNLRVALIPIRATLHIETTQSSFYHRTGGMGGGYSMEATHDRTLITTGFYPINFRVANNLRIHIGVEGSYLLSQKSSVKEHQFAISNPSGSTTEYNRVDVGRDSQFGFALEASWHAMIKEHWFLAPWCRFVYNTTDPFINTVYETRMMKTHGGVSLIRRLGFE